MGNVINVSALGNAIFYSITGIGIFGFGFWIFDRVTPYHLWKELCEDRNVALAIVVGAVALGICIIIASAIHG